MSAVHDEGKLRFTFDQDWEVSKWDQHPAFLDGLQKFQSTKAVDFVGLHIGAPWFLEVKDFRGYRIENKHRLSSLDLAEEVARKVRDTLAALVWACDRAPLDQRGLTTFLRPLVCRNTKVPVVLWLEEDRPIAPADASVLQEAIKRELIWLNPKVLVINRTLAVASPIAGLTVSSLP